MSYDPHEIINPVVMSAAPGSVSIVTDQTDPAQMMIKAQIKFPAADGTQFSTLLIQIGSDDARRLYEALSMSLKGTSN
jgi:hypothetical protein